MNKLQWLKYRLKTSKGENSKGKSVGLDRVRGIFHLSRRAASDTSLTRYDSGGRKHKEKLGQSGENIRRHHLPAL